MSTSLSARIHTHTHSRHIILVCFVLLLICYSLRARERRYLRKSIVLFGSVSAHIYPLRLHSSSMERVLYVQAQMSDNILLCAILREVVCSVLKLLNLPLKVYFEKRKCILLYFMQLYTFGQSYGEAENQFQLNFRKNTFF